MNRLSIIAYISLQPDHPCDRCVIAMPAFIPRQQLPDATWVMTTEGGRSRSTAYLCSHCCLGVIASLGRMPAAGLTRIELAMERCDA